MCKDRKRELAELRQAKAELKELLNQDKDRELLLAKLAYKALQADCRKRCYQDLGTCCKKLKKCK